MEFGPAGTPLAWPQKKDTYLKAKKVKVSTRTTRDIQEAMRAIKDGCVVELQTVVNAPAMSPGGTPSFLPVGGHVLNLQAVAKLSDGRYVVAVSDDVLQGREGGTYIHQHVFDPKNRLLWPPLNLPWVHYVFEWVIECVEP